MVVTLTIVFEIKLLPSNFAIGLILTYRAPYKHTYSISRTYTLKIRAHLRKNKNLILER